MHVMAYTFYRNSFTVNMLYDCHSLQSASNSIKLYIILKKERMPGKDKMEQNKNIS